MLDTHEKLTRYLYYWKLRPWTDNEGVTHKGLTQKVFGIVIGKTKTAVCAWLRRQSKSYDVRNAAYFDLLIRANRLPPIPDFIKGE